MLHPWVLEGSAVLHHCTNTNWYTPLTKIKIIKKFFKNLYFREFNVWLCTGWMRWGRDSIVIRLSGDEPRTRVEAAGTGWGKTLTKDSRLEKCKLCKTRFPFTPTTQEKLESQMIAIAENGVGRWKLACNADGSVDYAIFRRAAQQNSVKFLCVHPMTQQSHAWVQLRSLPRSVRGGR